MFEFLLNIILTGVFLQIQTHQQLTLDVLSQVRGNPTLSELNYLVNAAPQKKQPTTSEGVALSAKNSIVVDLATGKVLYEQNANEKRPIASLTKLMTALVFFDHNPGLDKTITIESSDYRAGAVTYLVAGETFSLDDVVHATMVASANEAAVALARATGLSGDDFVKAMNQKAKDLGMINSQFSDPTGLDPQDQSSAADVAKMLRAALEQPTLAKIIGSQQWDLTVISKGIKRHIASTDSILGHSFGDGSQYYWVEAGKTGHLDEAGYCFASLLKNNKNNEILSVVLDSETISDRFTDTKSLAYWVFSNYTWR